MQNFSGKKLDCILIHLLKSKWQGVQLFYFLYSLWDLKTRKKFAKPFYCAVVNKGKKCRESNIK